MPKSFGEPTLWVRTILTILPEPKPLAAVSVACKGKVQLGRTLGADAVLTVIAGNRPQIERGTKHHGGQSYG